MTHTFIVTFSFAIDALKNQQPANKRHKDRRHIFGNRAFALHVFLSLNVPRTLVKREHLGPLSFALNESSEIFRHFIYICLICRSLRERVSKRLGPMT